MCLASHPLPYKRMSREEELTEIAYRAFEEGYSYGNLRDPLIFCANIDQLFEKSEIRKTIKKL